MSEQNITDAFRTLAAKIDGETVTHARIERHSTQAGTIAVVTLDNDDKRPTTLGPNSLIELIGALETLHEEASAGEISAVAFIGKPGFFVAGADLSAVNRLETEEDARSMAQLGHTAYQLIHELPVPTFAFVNGAAMGGGLELALACDYRTVSAEAKGLSLPEAFIGLIPGWSGVYLLPRLIGPEAAMKVMIENPLSNNRTLKAAQAHELGLADALLPADSFLESSLAWAAEALADPSSVTRPNAVDPSAQESREELQARWDAAAAKARTLVSSKTGTAAPAPLEVIDAFEAGFGLTREQSRDREIETLTRLMHTDQFRNTVYAFLELVQKRGKRPAGAPDAALAEPVRKVGVVGAGLMAGQLALVFAQNLRVPVQMSDLDQERMEAGVARVHGQIDKLAAKGALTVEQVSGLKGLITGTIDQKDFADADFVIEAVFEELQVKKQVFAQLEQVVRPDCILATNTSSLSVSAMAEGLQHPERVVGFHFFNPVAYMPLIEIAATESTDEPTLATAFTLAAGLRKTAVRTKDATAFVVNRLLLRLMGEVSRAFDTGTDAHTADHALDPMGLPMTPFTLLKMVGIPVAQHVSESLHASFGDRFWVSPNQQRLIDAGIKGLWEQDASGTESIPDATAAVLQQGDAPQSAEQILTTVQDALAQEIRLMLDEGVVASPRDIDLCMILGAGWPFHLGGITPYLDQVGASERVTGQRFDAISAG